MKRINCISFLIALMFVSTAVSQQTRQTNLYGRNMYSLNPAYAGESGCRELHFSHINQWVRVEGAPTTNFFSGNARIGKSFGIGGNVLIDKLGMLHQVSASASAAYGFTFAKHHTIRLGLSGGYFQMRVDPTDAIAFDAGDNIVEGGVQSSNSITTEAGIMYKFKELELSFASKQLFETRTSFTYPNLDGYGLKRHMIGYVGYKLPISKQLSLKPSVMYKGVNNVHQFDFNADIDFLTFVTLVTPTTITAGLGYRTGVGMIGRLGINIREVFYIGYAYELPMQNIASHGAGSHEILLGLKFCKKPKPEELVVEPIRDTIYIVETVTDTLIIERVDTVYVEIKVPTNDDITKAMLQAADHLEFENDKAIILEESYGDLESLTNLLLMRKELKISLEGHTDNNGGEEYNMQLSKSRVEAVKDFFVANGVDPKRISTSHYGESRPIADNNTTEGQAQNRRVDMKIITD